MCIRDSSKSLVTLIKLEISQDSSVVSDYTTAMVLGFIGVKMLTYHEQETLDISRKSMTPGEGSRGHERADRPTRANAQRHAARMPARAHVLARTGRPDQQLCFAQSSLHKDGASYEHAPVD